MSLRYRLFLAVSGLFIIVALCSYFIENTVTRHGLKEAQEGLRAKIVNLSEKRRIDLESFIASILAENQERIDAILTNLSCFTPQVLRFGPTAGNQERGTWEEAADLLIEYKWLDFLQNTNQGTLAAAIVPKRTDLDPVFRIEIDEDLSWIYVEGFKEHPQPYLGIKSPYSLIARSPSNPLEIPEKMVGIIPEVYLLFNWQDMVSSSNDTTQPVFQNKDQEWPAIPVKWTEGYELEVTPIVKAFQRAREGLLTKKIQPPELTEATISEKMTGIVAKQQRFPLGTLFVPGASEEAIDQSLKAIALNYTQISMIWALIALSESGPFGDDLFHFPAPSAITLFRSGDATGSGVMAKEVLFSEKLFDDSGYFAKYPPKSLDSNLATSIAVITHPEHVYLGNTAQFAIKTPIEDRVGYMTLGIDAEAILQRLELAIQQTAIMVHEGKPICAFGEGGKPLAFASPLPISQMLPEKSGIISWQEQNYFFMHLQPFPAVDLHFFFLNPEDVEFALLRDLQNGSKQIIDSVLFDIHLAGLAALIIAILLLHYISRKVTNPIIQLAKATGLVAEGRLDQVQLSLPPVKHHDEVALLCHSFEEMVKGLQEKEKVKGVLNKVVSREIAQEILKGSVHLGGEEKKVTVLFADIREFTKMTQNMLPQQVIDLLNGCMTKVSSVIDKNGGVIDKFVGDEVMALFGAPISSEDATLKAIYSALEIVETLKTWNLQRQSQGLPAIEVGIGIHAGPVLVGNMGAENRLNYTVIGSNVNLASRLCSAAKRMEILITKDTLEEPFVKEKVMYEVLLPITLKGFDKEVEVFRITGSKL